MEPNTWLAWLHYDVLQNPVWIQEFQSCYISICRNISANPVLWLDSSLSWTHALKYIAVFWLAGIPFAYHDILVARKSCNKILSSDWLVVITPPTLLPSDRLEVIPRSVHCNEGDMAWDDSVVFVAVIHLQFKVIDPGSWSGRFQQT